jgi:hypothetical protein
LRLGLGLDFLGQQNPNKKRGGRRRGWGGEELGWGRKRGRKGEETGRRRKLASGHVE